MEELRHIRMASDFTNNLSSTRFIVSEALFKGGPRMGLLRGSSRVSGSHLSKFVSVFNDRANQGCVASTASCVDTPEIEEESPLKESSQDEPTSPQIEYALVE